MKVLRYNITKPKKINGKDGEKTIWNTVGTLTEFYKDDGSIGRLVEIPAISLEANAFPIKKDDDQERIHERPVSNQGGFNQAVDNLKF